MPWAQESESEEPATADVRDDAQRSPLLSSDQV
jgi:hypothetical protein